jgi:hypothetical protein
MAKGMTSSNTTPTSIQIIAFRLFQFLSLGGGEMDFLPAVLEAWKGEDWREE